MIPVKICGLTRPEDALLAAELGAAALGFIFHPHSPRWVARETVAAICRLLPPAVARVGVFVNPDLPTVVECATAAGLTHVQLHGRESIAFCRQVPLPVIKAIRTRGELEDCAGFRPAAFLIDSQTATQFGGTGRLADWTLCEQARTHAPVILAGGISAGNLAGALAVARPDALDLSSSVESSPGRKDHHKLREFFAAVHALAAAQQPWRNIFSREA
ncbi:MAG: phosphoribosylanthranilate isomerase [candidate division KSB1 bacterium]|nr:phosphoribosylanthranilate isomerase [candidate division KSB1 bacterium]MDZ7275928.1 phosphoribosylanthranilate isomerase [candidate division KSB1 bacterium]MDZ7285790.1 phosphoribosylanthranilate isomerase [candidate division KSB1 bacterium]MDZ7298822.1 phosphoribosylanthranilate isomerase [candidate division KSB1 bacterium]MDZ7308994.1 phosphoribosylanthranilate isomerase [candidate division KSB1 bacterium]